MKFRPLTANQLLQRNILLYGLGGVIAPFIAIKVIDVLISAVGLAYNYHKNILNEPQRHRKKMPEQNPK